MLRVIVCDPSKENCHIIANEIGKVIDEKNLQASIALETDDPSEAVRFVSADPGIYFITLEIVYHDKIKGLKAAERVRSHSKDTYIVFISGHSEYIRMTMRGLIRPSGFLEKPVSRNELRTVFYESYADYLNYFTTVEVLTLSIGAKLYHIKPEDILYFEASNKKIYLNTRNQRIGYYDSLDAINQKMESHEFVRCHKGFIINKKHIKSIDFAGMIITLSNDSIVPISRTYKNILREKVNAGGQIMHFIT